MGGLERDIDMAIIELLTLKNQGYIGIDVRIREGGLTAYTVSPKEEDLPENTSEDDIARLKEKLELLEKIRKMQLIIEKFNEEHPGFVPIRYPEIPLPNPWNPWTYNPWITCDDDNTGTPHTNTYEITCVMSGPHW